MTASATTITISLDRVAHHAGTIRSTEPLVVETSATQWEYAISLPLDVTAHPMKLPLRVSAAVTVVSGELGCLLVADDWTTMLGRMPPNARPGTRTVDLLLERGDGHAHLVFRNHGADRLPCVFRLDSITVTDALIDTVSGRLEEVLEPGGRRIDLARLKVAASSHRC